MGIYFLYTNTIINSLQFFPYTVGYIKKFTYLCTKL
nr:MAG TPA: hypothetical protein [Crassvirales sp.]